MEQILNITLNNKGNSLKRTKLGLKLATRFHITGENPTGFEAD